MQHVHHHPVVQKVLIGLFVWGMMLFTAKVALGMESQVQAEYIVFPVDMPQPLTDVEDLQNP